jgi:hypothetical protein
MNEGNKTRRSKVTKWGQFPLVDSSREQVRALSSFTSRRRQVTKLSNPPRFTDQLARQGWEGFDTSRCFNNFRMWKEEVEIAIAGNYAGEFTEVRS